MYNMYTPLSELLACVCACLLQTGAYTHRQAALPANQIHHSAPPQDSDTAFQLENPRKLESASGRDCQCGTATWKKESPFYCDKYFVKKRR